MKDSVAAETAVIIPPIAIAAVLEAPKPVNPLLAVFSEGVFVQVDQLKDSEAVKLGNPPPKAKAAV